MTKGNVTSFGREGRGSVAKRGAKGGVPRMSIGAPIVGRTIGKLSGSITTHIHLEDLVKQGSPPTPPQK